MSIEQEARAASVRIYPTPHAEPRNANERRSNGIASAHRAGYVGGYIAGASREVTDEEVEKAVEGIEKRLAWASIHWGTQALHSDALPHIARAALEAARAAELRESAK